MTSSIEQVNEFSTTTWLWQVERAMEGININININICSIKLKWDGKTTEMWYDNMITRWDEYE